MALQTKDMETASPCPSLFCFPKAAQSGALAEPRCRGDRLLGGAEPRPRGGLGYEGQQSCYRTPSPLLSLSASFPPPHHLSASSIMFPLINV